MTRTWLLALVFVTLWHGVTKLHFAFCWLRRHLLVTSRQNTLWRNAEATQSDDYCSISQCDSRHDSKLMTTPCNAINTADVIRRSASSLCVSGTATSSAVVETMSTTSVNERNERLDVTVTFLILPAACYSPAAVLYSRLNYQHNWNETETKPKQNSFKTVLKQFLNCFFFQPTQNAPAVTAQFVSVSFPLCGQFN